MLRTSAVLALALVFGLPAAAHPASRLVFTPRAAADSEVSTNWAGYAVRRTGTSGAPISFTDVTGTWTVPHAACTPGNRTFSAFWVGLGGFSSDSQALEQIGSETDCTSAGMPLYRLWYEIVPAPAVPIAVKVAPGDRVTAAVLVSGTQVILQITNRTRRVRFTKRVIVATPDLSSAEWIAEAPSACDPTGGCRTLPLTRFGAVSFTGAAATGDGHAGTISDPSWTATSIELAEAAPGGFDPRLVPAPTRPTTGAAPGPLSTDGRGFTVSWQPNVAG